MIDLEYIKQKKSKYFVTVFLSVLAATLLTTSVGFSALNQNLNIAGDIEFEENSKTLYSVLKKEAELGTYAKEYTGTHHDSFTEEPSQKIYHWYIENKSSNSTIAQEISNKNNVIFANHCWQMIRTTDTGGVKLLYNGEVDNDQCLNTRSDHTGYDGSRSQMINGNYYYADSYYIDEINNKYVLEGNVFQSPCNDSTKESLVRKFTCLSENTDGCSTLYYVEKFGNNSNYLLLAPLYPNNASYENLGTSPFSNVNSLSPSDMGYMNNTYMQPVKVIASTYIYLQGKSVSNTQYWVADSYNYNNTTGKYELINPIQVNGSTTSSMKNKYTFFSTNQSYKNGNINYVTENINGNAFYLILKNGQVLTDVQYNITYGASYTKNQDGTYTINSPATIDVTEWYSYQVGVKEKYVCINATNNTCEDLMYAGYTENTRMYYLHVDNNYVFGNSFTYQNGVYTLSNDRIEQWNIIDLENFTLLNNYHYTCWNKTGVCDTLSYIYGTNYYGFYSTGIYYYNIENGELPGNYLNKLLLANDVNTYDSSIKAKVDAWYKNYLTNYDDYIEDTIYCNNRDYTSIGGWNPNGGFIKDKVLFQQDSLYCSRDTDRFSTLNNKAKLKYPVGLVTSIELELMGHPYTRKADEPYWTMSPQEFQYIGVMSDCDQYGYINSCSLNTLGRAIRPMISLKAGTEYISGTGTKADPYLVHTLS